MSTLSATQQHIEALAALSGKGTGPVSYEFLKAYGRAFTPVKTEITASAPLGRCYLNALNCLDESHFYCEGLAISRNLFPMAHGWITSDGKTCVDPTWEDGGDYFGVVFTHDFREDFSGRTGLASVFEGLYALRKMSRRAVFKYLESGLKTF